MGNLIKRKNLNRYSNSGEEQVKIKSAIIDTIPEKPMKITDEYRIGAQLGSGRVGIFHIATHIATGSQRAIRKYKKTDMDPLEINNVLVLAKLQYKFNHPNLVRVFEIFQEKGYLYLVYEFFSGGPLFDVIQKSANFSEKDAANILKQILAAGAYLHSNLIVHRDLKPENILYNSETKQLKIVDFKLCRIFKHGVPMTSCHGTPYYMAPETIKENYDEKIDVWACGVIFYIMLSGCPPFNASTDEEILMKIKRGDYSVNLPAFEKISESGMDLLKKLLTYEPKDRPSMQEALKHPFFTSNLNEAPMESGMIQSLRNFEATSSLGQEIKKLLIDIVTEIEEKEELINAFKALDTVGEGFLTRGDIKKGLEGKHIRLGSAELEEILSAMDPMNSKGINFNDFIARMFEKRSILSEEKIKKYFGILDKEKTGTITKEDLKTALVSEVSDPLVTNFTLELENSGKEALSLTDFKQLIEKMHKELK